MRKYNYFFVVLFSMYLLMSSSHGMQFNSTMCPTCKPCDSSSAPVPRDVVVAVIAGCIGITLEKATSCLSKGLTSFWYACCKAPDPKKEKEDICHPCYKGFCQSSKRCLKMWCACNKPSYVKYIQEEEEEIIKMKFEEANKNIPMNYGNNSLDLLSTEKENKKEQNKKEASPKNLKNNNSNSFSFDDDDDD